MKKFTWALAAGFFASGVCAEVPEGGELAGVNISQRQSSPGENGVELGLSRTLTRFNKASSFLGMPVHNQSRQIGKVKELVFDIESGKIGYVVLALDAVTGNGQRLVPVPPSAVQPAEGSEHLVLNMSEVVLAAAEGVTEGDYPEVTTFAIGGPAEAEQGTGQSSGDLPKEPSVAPPARNEPNPEAVRQEIAPVE